MFLPEDYKPSKLITVLSFIVLGCGITYSIYLAIKNKNALDGDTRYTIGYTKDLVWETSGRAVRYTYSFNGRNFEGIATYAYTSKVPDGRYLIKFSVKEPEVSVIYQNYPIPDEIKYAPTDGWKKINQMK